MPVRMQHVARGPRPQFSENVEVDRVMAMVMALAGEVAVLREQLDTVVSLAAARGVLTPEEVASHAPGLEQVKSRDEWRQAFIGRVLYALHAEAETGVGPPSASSP
jgi:hypothetical protein